MCGKTFTEAERNLNHYLCSGKQEKRDSCLLTIGFFCNCCRDTTWFSSLKCSPQGTISITYPRTEVVTKNLVR